MRRPSSAGKRGAPFCVEILRQMLFRGARRGAALVFLSALTSGASIVVKEVEDQGQASYRIETPSAIWTYHREGGGFSSLIDPAGHDWIAYRPDGGAKGNFRGIPNAVHRARQTGNNFFHPGHSGPKGAHTTIVAQESARVVLRSESTDARWVSEWEILPDRAKFRLTRMPKDDSTYWVLYEGTPGGRFNLNDLVVRPGNVSSPVSETWEASTREVAWVAFVSAPSKHTLVMVAHNPPETRVSYRPMQDAMTVFGFGRKHGSLEGLLTEPVTFTVAVIPEIEPAKISEWVRR